MATSHMSPLADPLVSFKTPIRIHIRPFTAMSFVGFAVRHPDKLLAPSGIGIVVFVCVQFQFEQSF